MLVAWPSASRRAARLSIVYPKAFAPARPGGRHDQTVIGGAAGPDGDLNGEETAMDFDLTGEQRRWRDLARDFAQAEIRPRAETLDREARFPYDLIGRMFDLGLMGLSLPAEYGGSGGDFLSFCLALEEISQADTGIAITMEVQVTLGCGMLATYGTPAQRERLLAPCLTGGRLWAFGLTEEQAGTDAGNPATTAALEGGRWMVNGSKRYITSSGTEITAGITVLARTGWREPRPDGTPRPELSAILVPRGTPGFTCGPAYDKLGWRTANQHPLSFADCAVPEENLLGERGAGFRQFLEALDGGRVAMGALSVGLAQACLDEALAHARRRRQFGRSLAEFQAIQFKLADMAMEIELARTMVLKAAWLRQLGRPHHREASMAKVFASETAKRAADQACQILGGEGFMWASPVARYWRQVKINEIGEGTSEINRQIIARDLLAEPAAPPVGA
jgi:butyryl-CoA dehydrogenase